MDVGSPKRPTTPSVATIPSRENDVLRALDLHLRVARLWTEKRDKAKGERDREIAEQVGRSARQVQRIVKMLPAVARAARDVSEELRKLGYNRKTFDFREIAARSHVSQWERLRQGFWPYSEKIVPVGYRLSKDGTINVDPVKGSALGRVWQRIIKGEIINQAAREENIDPASIQRILRNPMFWIGDVRSQDGYVKGRHKALLDRTTYEKIQSMRPGTMGPAAFGFRREGREIIPDELQKKIVLQVFQLSREGKPGREIAEKLSLNYSLVYRTLHDPRNKPVVGYQLWNSAQQPHSYPQNRRGSYNRNRILACLPATTNEVMEKTGLSWAASWQHLDKLRKGRLVEREGGRLGKWKRVT